MNCIQKRDIDFSKLSELSCAYHSESNLYHDEQLVYKMFDLTFRELCVKEKNLRLLQENKQLEQFHVLLPKKIIYNGRKLSGYMMDYIKDGIPLFDFSLSNLNVLDFLGMVKQASEYTRGIHQSGLNIVIGDLSFDNIIFDKDYQVYFCDFDSCVIMGDSTMMISSLLATYLKNHHISLKLSKDTDKLCLILCTLYVLFPGKSIDSISMEEYDTLSTRIEFLQNIREYILNLKETNGSLPSIPYIDECISMNDLTHSTKLLRKFLK